MANTQTSIERQSSLKLALKWASQCGQCLTISELVAISENLVDYIENGRTPDVTNRLKKIDDFYGDKNNPTK